MSLQDIEHAADDVTAPVASDCDQQIALAQLSLLQNNVNPIHQMQVISNTVSFQALHHSKVQLICGM
jgi:hypothetical protein